MLLRCVVVRRVMSVPRSVKPISSPEEGSGGLPVELILTLHESEK